MEDEILKLFSDISIVFKAFYQDPYWIKAEESFEDPLEAARFFIGSYAYEHQGRSPSYPPAAEEAIKMSESARDSKDYPLEVWTRFCELLKNKNLARKINPLCHPCKRCQPFLSSACPCSCIWCTLGNENVVIDSKRDLKAGRTKEAWVRLVKIRGIGPKIASLFLRDVAVWFSDEFTPIKDDRWLLQPIDIWVRRVVTSRNPEIKGDKCIAEWIVDNCDKPELCNQGIWYFGSRIASSEFKVDYSLHDINHVKALLRDHIQKLKNTAKAAESFESQQKWDMLHD